MPANYYSMLYHRHFLFSFAVLSLVFPSGILKVTNAAEVSGNFILQIKEVPGYVMPDATTDPYHTKAFFASSIELFLTQSLKKTANQNSKFSLLDIYKVEMQNQVVGKTTTAADYSNNETDSFTLRPLYVNLTISGEYTPVRKQKDSIDSNEYQHVLLQLFQDYESELVESLKDLVHIPYFSHVTTLNAIASSVLSTQAKVTLDAMEEKQQKMKEKKFTSAITLLSIGGVGILLLSIISVRIISTRLRYSQMKVHDEANNDDFVAHHSSNNAFITTSSLSDTNRIPPTSAFDYINNPNPYFGYNIHSSASNASVPYRGGQEFSMADGLQYNNNNDYNYTKESDITISSFTTNKEILQQPCGGQLNINIDSKPAVADQQRKQQKQQNEDDGSSMERSTTASNASSSVSSSSSSKRSSASYYAKLRAEHYDGVKRHCFAPPGKLGVAIEDGPVGVGPVVHKVKSGSPLEGILKSCDRIISIDDADTRELSAADVTAWMVEKMACRRKISYMTLKQGILF